MISYTNYSSIHSVKFTSVNSSQSAASAADAKGLLAKEQSGGQGHPVHSAKTLSVSASYSQSSTVSFSVQQTPHFQNPTYGNPALIQQGQVGDQANMTEASDAAEGTKAVSDLQEKAETNAYAGKILSFISAQLQRDVADGASEEELASRLQAGLDGFKSGYGDALEQLKGAGFLSDEVAADIQTTYDQVLRGIDELAKELGIESPVADEINASENQTTPDAETVNAVPAPVVVQTREDRLEAIKTELAKPMQNLRILESFEQTQKQTLLDTRSSEGERVSQSRHDVAESRKYSFSLTTADGDKVTIRASAMKAESASFGGFSEEAGSASVARYAQSSQESFMFSVEGELDEDELKAINELLGKVNDIAQSFFGGDVEAAFEKAQNIGFDSDEISSFALNLKMARVERVQNTYQSIGEPQQHQGNSFNGMHKLANFVQSIQEAGQFAESIGQRRSLVADLADFVSNNVHANQENAHRFGPFVSRFL